MKRQREILELLKLADMNMVDLVPVKDKEEDYSKQEKLAAVLERIIKKKTRPLKLVESRKVCIRCTLFITNMMK